MDEIRQAKIFGVRPKRIFRVAATKFLKDNMDLKSIGSYANALAAVDDYVGDLPLDAVHMGTLQPFIDARKAADLQRRKGKVSTRTINYSLQGVRRVLNLAAQEWKDEFGLSWLLMAPKIKLLKGAKRPPCPISWEEQDNLFPRLPLHLRRMCLFKVNTGTREQEVCGLRWDYEIKIPELNTSVFVIPGDKVKNELDRLVVLNEIAKQQIEEVRGEHPKYVFTYNGHSVTRIHNTAWQRARAEAGLPDLHVHDLKHTFGRRLRSAGVSEEDKQDLLGHKSNKISTHYSVAEIGNLIEAANKVVTMKKNTPVLRVIKNVVNG